jgi:D-citramalate synthase
MKVEIMDTTLRDGEQTSGVSFTETEKLNVAKMLLKEVCVDRIEIASARVSEGEFKSVKLITDWAKKEGYLDKIEILGFIDKNKSIDWIKEANAKVINLLCKGSLKHVMGQLRKTPEQHISDIKESIAYAHKNGIDVNLYLEDWSNGMKNSPDYVFQLINSLKNENIMRFMLPDTLGILTPSETYEYCLKITKEFPDIHFDFHGHNDYDLVIANSLESVKAGIKGVHTTINGLGERAGNACLSSVVAVLKDHLKAEISVNEKELYKVSKVIEVFSGLRIPQNKPVIGEYVFTQCCGVHADGDKKGNLYYNDLMPERFGRVRKYALGKSSGKASILKNIEEMGIELTQEEMALVTNKVVELGDKKETITAEDLPYIISDVLGSEIIKQRIKINNYYICNSYSLRPVATVSLCIDDKTYEETSTGDGQYDAFVKAIGKIYKNLNKKIPLLTDYVVTIPPGGKTDALVETIITWMREDGYEFKTRGLDSDQTAAAIKATIKMLNIIDNGK